MKKKSIDIDLNTLWERHSKSRKVDVGSSSGSEIQSVTVESEDIPSVQPVTDANESPVQIEITPVKVLPEVEASDVARDVIEPKTEVASNDPDIAAAVSEEEQPSTWSPIRDWSPIKDGDDEETEYDSSDEAIYDIDLLCHYPRRRIPIKNYDVNERNFVIRGFIALGPCQPSSDNFPGGKP
jgi:hypothetical protein